MDKEKNFSELPFPLAYLEWCKTRGIKKIEDTERRDLIRVFYKEVWEPAGKELNGIDFIIAMGKNI